MDVIFSNPGQRQGLLYKHRHNSLIYFLIRSLNKGRKEALVNHGILLALVCNKSLDAPQK